MAADATLGGVAMSGVADEESGVAVLRLGPLTTLLISTTSSSSTE